MLTNLEPRAVTSVGAVESNVFQIKANGKAFKVLIDGLYSDKIRAVIRELWSNAYDSHVEAGCPETPFFCHMPTTWEPHFSVRDYGVSLSHDGVMRLYTTVFESSKEGTNTQVGKLGLGSKSPFAYTDVFTVTAWMDGKKRLYSAYIGTDYVPRIDFLGAYDSDEPNGLEISFPVKSDDIDDFTLAAARTVNGFEVAPTNNIDLQKTTKDALFEGNGWKLYGTSDYGHKAHAKQGCVIYPIDSYAVSGLTSAQRDLLKSALYIEFPIGELEISASRESLGYDAPTCANIVRRMATIEQEIIDQFQARFAHAQTRWEALCFVNDLRHSGMPQCILGLLDKLRFRGEPVGNNLHVNVRNLSAVSRFHVVYRRNGYRLDPAASSAYVVPGEFKVFTIGKDEQIPGMFARIQQWVEDNGGRSYKNVFVVRADAGSFAMRKVIAAFGRMDTSEWIAISSLPKPTKTSNYVRKPVKAREIVGSQLREVEIDLNDGGYYVPMDRGDIEWNGRKFAAAECSKVFNALIDVGIIPKGATLHGIPASLKRAYEKKDSSWLSVFGLADQFLTDSADDMDKLARLQYLNVFLGDENHMVKLCVKAHEAGFTPDTLPTGLFRRYFTVINNLCLERSRLMAMKFTSHIALAQTLQRMPDVRDVPSFYTSSADRIVRAYPMLEMVIDSIQRRYSWSTDVFTKLNIQSIFAYVKLVDAE